MSDREVLFIFHYGSDFEFDISCLVYNGGKQKMRYLAIDITYESLVKEAIEASNGDSSSIQNISMQYLHHNGRAFSMASIDVDVRSMFKASGDESNGIYLYVFNGRNKEQCVGGDNLRFHRSYVCHSCTEKSKNSSGSWRKKQGLNTTSCGYIPTVDIRGDKDMYFPIVGVDCNPRQTDGQDIVDDDVLFGTNHDDDNHLDGPPCIGKIHSIPMLKAESKFEGVNPINEALDCNESSAEVAGANPNNESFRCNETPVVGLEDKMEPWDIKTDVGNNSGREMWIGREFQDRQTFRNTLAKFAIYSNFTLRPLKTNMTKVTARCRDQECPWRIHASRIESGPQFKVRTYNPTHKCSRPMMGMAHRQASSALITEFIMDRVRQNVNLKPKEIMNDYQIEFGVTISYKKAYIAKEMALNMVRGSYEDSFQKLPLYCKEFHMSNPGTITNIVTTTENRFRRFFWAFGPCLRSFMSSLRPVIAVDRSHLLGKYLGIFLMAITHDANQKLLPIAFGFAEAERRHTWEWFLANLFLAFGEPANLTVVSDCQKGLIPALKTTIPFAFHCYYCRHIAENKIY